MRRRPGRPSLSNEELLDTALDLFLENGFDRTSIDAITSAAGMAKRTVYARYGDKATLFKEAFKRAIEEWIVPVERLRAEETEDLEETLFRIGHILLANLLSPAGLRLLRLTNAESLHMPEISLLSVTRGTGPTLAYLEDLFDRRIGADGKALPNAASTAQVFLNMVVGGPAINAAWGLTIEPDEVENHVRHSVSLFLHGVLDGHAVPPAAENVRLRTLLEDATAQLDQVRSQLVQATKLSRK